MAATSTAALLERTSDASHCVRRDALAALSGANRQTGWDRSDDFVARSTTVETRQRGDELTLTEARILQAYGVSIAHALGDRVRLIEYGQNCAGNTRILLEALEAPAAYVPVHRSSVQVRRCAASLSCEVPKLAIHPVVADFTGHLSLPSVASRRSIVFVPGATFEGLELHAGEALLRKIRLEVGNAGGALVGIDLQRLAHETAAEDFDARTNYVADLALSMLAHGARTFDADFKLAAIAHLARNDRAAIRVKTDNIAPPNQVRTADQTAIARARREAMLMNFGQQYALESFSSLASKIGLRVAGVWSDPRRCAALVLLNSFSTAAVNSTTRVPQIEASGVAGSNRALSATQTTTGNRLVPLQFARWAN